MDAPDLSKLGSRLDRILADQSAGLIGTLSYMSPGKLRNTRGSWPTYALGIILYRC